MVVKGKPSLGPILGIIGAGMLIIGGIVSFNVRVQKELELAALAMTWTDVGFNPNLYTVSSTLTIVWGMLGLFGAIIALFGKRFGVYFMLIFGIIATAGMFIPIGSYLMAFIPNTVFLNTSWYLADPIILLLGGILGVAFKEL